MVRAGLFYVGYILFTIFWGTLSVLAAWVLPYRKRFFFIVTCWTGGVLWWLRKTCGITWRIEGAEHIPEEPCIVFSRHESTWETLFLQQMFAPQATIIKRELLWIPFFGWAFALLKPIAIDRSAGRKALRQLIETGRERLQDRIWVAVFPEGTRMPAGQAGKVQAGGPALAAATGAPILMLVHDAGAFWPAHQMRKRAGEITVRILPPIETEGRNSKAISAECQAQLDRAVAELSAR